MNTCATWLQFLDDVTGGDAEAVAAVRTFLRGVLDAGFDHRQKFLVLNGPAGSGKSTIVRVAAQLSQGMVVSSASMLVRSFGMAPVMDADLLVLGDCSSPRRGLTGTLNERLLDLVARERIYVDRPRQDPVMRRFTGSVLLVGEVGWVLSSSLKRRCVTVNLRVISNFDRTIPSRLDGEVEAIRAWVMGSDEPPAVTMRKPASDGGTERMFNLLAHVSSPVVDEATRSAMTAAAYQMQGSPPVPGDEDLRLYALIGGDA